MARGVPFLLALRPLVGLLVPLALLLIATLVVAAPSARADHGPETTEETAWEEGEDEFGWEDEVEATVEETPAPVAPVAPPAPAAPPIPARDDVFWPEDEAPAPLPAEPAPAPAPVIELPPLVTSRTVKGKVARLRTDGKAAIPRSAPKRVKEIIAAANQIVGKPYKWGGGHARLIDKGYDCSGAVSYALIRAGLLNSPLVSGSLAKWGQKDAGRHVAVYANKGHVYMEVAGLRLDTSPVADPTGGKGPRWRPVIGRRAGFHARHPLGL